jgi:transcriptional regulator with XRE-family HTH domain
MMPHSEITDAVSKKVGPTIGSHIRGFRKKARLSQAELSRKCGMTPRNLRYIEAGERNFFEGTVFLLRLSAALGVSLKDLFEGTHVPLGPLGKGV